MSRGRLVHAEPRHVRLSPEEMWKRPAPPYNGFDPHCSVDVDGWGLSYAALKEIVAEHGFRLEDAACIETWHEHGGEDGEGCEHGIRLGFLRETCAVCGTRDGG